MKHAHSGKALHANLLYTQVNALHKMRTWQSVAYVHTMISSGHTGF